MPSRPGHRVAGCESSLVARRVRRGLSRGRRRRLLRRRGSVSDYTYTYYSTYTSLQRLRRRGSVSTRPGGSHSDYTVATHTITHIHACRGSRRSLDCTPPQKPTATLLHACTHAIMEMFMEVCPLVCVSKADSPTCMHACHHGSVCGSVCGSVPSHVRLTVRGTYVVQVRSIEPSCATYSQRE